MSCISKSFGRLKMSTRKESIRSEIASSIWEHCWRQVVGKISKKREQGARFGQRSRNELLMYQHGKHIDEAKQPFQKMKRKSDEEPLV